MQNSENTRKTGVKLYWLLVAAVASSLVTLAVDRRINYTQSAHIFAAFSKIGVNYSSKLRVSDSPPHPSEKPSEEPWRVIVRVVDGDTLVLDDGSKVRLQGIDAPESSACQKLYADLGKIGGGSPDAMLALGRLATEHARSLAEGKRCWLEWEHGGSVDIHDRPLVYAHLEDGTVLNAAMVADGYARVYHRQFRYRQHYLGLQDGARQAEKGLWKGAPRKP